MTAVAATENTGQVVAAVRKAAVKTGADFDYLLRTATRESSLKSDAKATTSSAAGLFQFIEQTWLGVVKRNGEQFGLKAEAEAIQTDSRGRYKVSDRATREAILALRHDPEVSSLMAGAHANESAEALARGIGRDPSEGELYMAHFLGTGGATKLINALKTDPDVRAAELFPAAANANRPIFYRNDGSARSVAEVYERLDRQPALPAAAETAVAALEDAPGQVAGAYGAMSSHARMASSGYRMAGFSSAGQSGSGPLVFGLGQSGPGPLTLALSRSPIPNANGQALVLTPQVIDVLSSLGTPETGDADDETEAREERAERAAERAYNLPAEDFAWLRGGTGLRGTLA